MKFSCCILPAYPLADSIETIKTADELGYHACYSVDETWWKDLWVLFAAAADKTSNIRFGPNVTHVFLREPTLICQQLATLDELTGGRMEAVVSTGNFGLMQQYHIDWAKRKPLSRLKEAMHVMRTFLDEGKIDFQGDFFQYTGLFTAARPVQERIPLLHGRHEGAEIVQSTAGEIADGLHHALAYSREAYDYLVENVREGASNAGRSCDGLDVGAWVVTVVGRRLRRREACRADARRPSTSPRWRPSSWRATESRSAELQPVVDALGGGDIAKRHRAVPPDCREALARRHARGGRREDQADIEPAGVNHMILALSDSHLVKFFSGEAVEGVPDVADPAQAGGRPGDAGFRIAAGHMSA